MSGGPLGARVAPSNDAFGGGTMTPASNPTAVSGSFGGPGTAANMPNVPMANILTARNNSGTNVRIPYARYATHHFEPCSLCISVPSMVGFAF